MALDIPPIPDLFDKRNQETGQGIGQRDKDQGNFRGISTGSATTSLGGGDQVTVTFAEAYAEIPLVFVSPQSQMTVFLVDTVTAKSFRCATGLGNTGFNWLAIPTGESVV